jgi:hypothetical protein
MSFHNLFGAIDWFIFCDAKFDQQYNVFVEGAGCPFSGAPRKSVSFRNNRAELLALVGELFEFFDENPARRLRISQSSTIPLASLVNLPVNFRAPQLVFVAAAGKTHSIFFTNSTSLSEPLSGPLPPSFRGESISYCNECLVRLQ